jgi:hypothetical protein
MKGMKDNLFNKQFGRLTVLKMVETTSYGAIRWLCQCSCGTITVVFAHNLKSGNTQSCGCLHNEMAAKACSKHGYYGTPTYKSWESMKARCQNPNIPDWKNYGEKGIRFCKRWEVFENFLADMGERPSGTSLDRYPNKTGNYEPNNCRWATASQQNKNRQRWKWKSR